VQARVSELFERLRLPIYRYLVVVLGRTGEAEELTQEAFIRLYERLRAGHGSEDANPWLFRVAHNLGISALRKRRFRVPLDEDVWTDLCDRLTAAPEQESRLLDDERRRRVAAALGGLSAQERQCLALRAEGIRYREISEVLGITHAAAVDSIRRAIAKLTRAIHE
jgi:RNA polymerase sigma-70 factor (ECF subfamily)